MTSAARPSPPATASDLLAFPDEQSVEVIGGVVEKAAPSYEHGDAQSSLAELLSSRPFSAGVADRGDGGSRRRSIATAARVTSWCSPRVGQTRSVLPVRRHRARGRGAVRRVIERVDRQARRQTSAMILVSTEGLSRGV